MGSGKAFVSLEQFISLQFLWELMADVSTLVSAAARFTECQFIQWCKSDVCEVAEACSYIRMYVYMFLGPTKAEIAISGVFDTQDFDMVTLDPFSYILKFEWCF